MNICNKLLIINKIRKMILKQNFEFNQIINVAVKQLNRKQKRLKKRKVFTSIISKLCATENL